MHKVVTITDVPDSDVDEVVKDFKNDGATTVTKVRQDSGHWIVTAIYPDQTDAGIAPEDGDNGDGDGGDGKGATAAAKTPKGKKAKGGGKS